MSVCQKYAFKDIVTRSSTVYYVHKSEQKQRRFLQQTPTWFYSCPCWTKSCKSWVKIKYSLRCKNYEQFRHSFVQKYILGCFHSAFLSCSFQLPTYNSLAIAMKRQHFKMKHKKNRFIFFIHVKHINKLFNLSDFILKTLRQVSICTICTCMHHTWIFARTWNNKTQVK